MSDNRQIVSAKIGPLSYEMPVKSDTFDKKSPRRRSAEAAGHGGAAPSAIDQVRDWGVLRPLEQQIPSYPLSPHGKGPE